MKTLLDPRKFLHDRNATYWEVDQRQDLTASDVEQVGTGQYVIWKYRAPKGQVVIVKGMAHYAFARTAVGNPVNESMSIIPGSSGNGFFLYSPRLESGTPFQMNLDYNAPQTAGGSPLNTRRQAGSGRSNITDQPLFDALRTMEQSFFTIKIPSEKELSIVFSLLPASPTSPIPNTYAVGSGQKRVDFAGSLLVGLQMSESYYDEIVRDMDNNKHV